MRKYIKTLREQFDNNSVIFKQAKRMFHYVPGNSQNRNYGLGKAQKSRVAQAEQGNQFKDDFSSVKDLKNQNNDINESSWIAKLVNGIEDHSLEDLKGPLSKEFKSRLSSASDPKQIQKPHSSDQSEQTKSIKSQNVIIIANEDRVPLQETFNRPLDSLPTKKNSYNFKKKPQVTERTPKTKTRNSSIGQNIQNKDPKGAIKSSEAGKQLKKKGSKSHVKAKTGSKELGPRKKSLQNIYLFKPREEAWCSSSENNKDQLELSSLKITDKATTEKKFTYSHLTQQKSKPNESVLQMDEIKHIPQEQSLNLEENNEKSNYLKESHYQPLFQEPLRQTTEHCGDTVAKNRNGCGSIRKNSKKIAAREGQSSSFKQESTEAILSPKFISNSKLNEAVIQKSGDKDIISASEEKVLVEKYLRISKDERGRRPSVGTTAYFPPRKDSIKKYNYEINRQEPQLYLNADAIARSTHQNANRPVPRLQYQRHYQTNHVKLSQMRSRQVQDKNKQDQDRLGGYRNNFTYRTNMYRQKPIIYSQKTIDRQLCAVEQQATLPRQHRPQVSNQRKQVLAINKNAYLQSQSDSVFIESHQTSKSKNQFGTITYNMRTVVPTKYSYIAFNSAKREDPDRSNLYSSGEKKTNHTNIQGSDRAIDRLNSKLSLYISQHILKDDSGRDNLNEWREEEATHRAMHLNFDELKKHGQILKR